MLKFSSWSDNHCQVEDISLSSRFATFDLNPKLLIWCVGQFKIISRDIEIKKYASGNNAFLLGDTDEAENDYENEVFKRWPLGMRTWLVLKMWSNICLKGLGPPLCLSHEIYKCKPHVTKNVAIGYFRKWSNQFV